MSTRKISKRFVFATPLLVLALAGAACGGGSDNAADKASSTTSTSAGGNAVVIETFAFAPKVLRVHVGDTVRWTNKDDIVHTVTSGTREYDPSDSGRVTATHKSGAFDMPLDGKASKASFTFKEAGTVHYFCDRHPGMEADIEVS